LDGGGRKEELQWHGMSAGKNGRTTTAPPWITCAIDGLLWKGGTENVKQLLEQMARKGSISGPYKTRQLTSFACRLREPGPLPLWVRYRTRRELEVIERMEDPPRPVKKSILFGLFCGVE